MHLQALDTLGVTKDKFASILLPMVESALPENLLRTWNRCRAQEQGQDLSKLVDFLRKEVESEERVQLAKYSGFDDTAAVPKPPTACFFTKDTRPKASSSPSMSGTCIWCDKDSHSATECHKAAKMTLQSRKEHLQNKKACNICFKTNHQTKKCKSFPKCLFCKKRHFTIMCPELANRSDVSDNNRQPEASSNLSCQTVTTTLLQTFVVKIVHGKKEFCIRALIDTGAQRSYIKKDLVQKLGLKPASKEFLSHCLFGGLETKKEERQVFEVCLQSTVNNFCMNLYVLEQEFICSFLPKCNSPTVLERLNSHGISLTDKLDGPDEVSLLIGADYLGSLLTGEFISLGNNLTAINTKMGWTIQGPVTGVYSSIANMSVTLNCLSHIDLADLWNLEALGIRDPAEQSSKSQHFDNLLKAFEDTIKVNNEGRYEVALPWRDVPRPQENYELARKRLESTEKRLKQIGKLNDYNNVFEEWLKLDIIEPAPDQSIKGHYMPHHAVIKEASLTTKVRPVFDAAARDRNGISLNSCLEKGVNLLEQIPNLLIHFRKNKFGVTADITKAFLQISLIPEDRDYLRFLWWSTLDEENRTLVTYRHRRVVFGVTSSPFHLAATINHHLDNSPEKLRNTAMKLKKSFYVDNCVTSLESEEDLDKFIRESKEIMLRGKFDLRGWISSPKLVDENVENTSILGLVWNVRNDSLQCNANLKTDNEKFTKRTLLSIAQRVFDPIGIACPTTIMPKMILQKSWCRKLTWDEELPTDLAKQFKKWLEHAYLINDCVIPRRFSSLPINESEVSLHVFCDASKEAYSACIFLRIQHREHVDVSLVIAKSRVTPVNEITMPRLELIAATLGTRLSMTAIESLGLSNCATYYWTDSSVVLTWIKCNGPWTVFVSNRVKEIKSLSAPSAWRHVPGHLNPADLPSRGIDPKGLLESQWWEGPSWLRLGDEDWPNTEIVFNSSDVDTERKKSCTHSLLVEQQESFLNRLSYFSNYNKIVRMICWILRMTKRGITKELTYDEYEYAEGILIKLVQQKNKNSLLCDKTIQTFVDENGIIRLNTKLALSTGDRDFKFPIVLPGAETIVRRLVEQRHIDLQHAGVQTLMCNLRQTFWIVGQRRLIRSIVSQCIRCKRFKAKRFQAPTGGLPIERMKGNAAFQFSGVDLAGPLLLRSGTKAWIVLFTCATYRAVHLEVVESLSTSEFLMALRRFVARRGRVDCLFSDNGTNFRGLDNAFSSLDWDEIQRFSSITRIKWNFLPPAAPWWGGFYERMIGFMKQILRRVLGRAAVTLVELHTVLCDCEAVINSRPLTCMGDQNELQPLTPSSFIQPLPHVHVTDFDEIDKKTLNLRQRYCQKLREDLRKRFKEEYISSLIQRGKRLKHVPLQVRDVVLLEGDSQFSKRITWPLAIVEELHEGTDGVCRVARVRTADGVKVRPVQRLFALEVPNDRPDRHDI
ncbi:hypothetical protein ABMA27_009669 [Loxostege sticticalis]|uniref:Integrase catalytic domain-containing protein n=1 Tax=Loxostege sticticalis TaxID=481309 RepID=A0ABR3H8R9_LOXSC